MYAIKIHQWRHLTGEIRDEAHRGYDDSRRTVSAMLNSLAQKRRDANCKEVAKDGMTCFQCTDAKGFQVCTSLVQSECYVTDLCR